MPLVIPTSESNSEVDYLAIRGFGSTSGVTKIGAGIQVGRLAYASGKYAYKKYINWATKSPSRAAGTATGAGLGIGGFVNNAIFSPPPSSADKIRQTRGNMEFSKRKRKYKTRCPPCRCSSKRR